MDYIFDNEKNNFLKLTRGICFEEIIDALENGKLLDVKPHHNPLKYPNQDILIIEIDQYAYIVPSIQKDGKLILKTIYPSRKETIKYLKKGETV